jgi:molybdopterin-guanine dinucleotide biosynthesis protein A
MVPIGDSTLGGRVLTALRRAEIDPVVAVGGEAGSKLGLVTVPDRWQDQGPLAGLASVLWWAKRGHVLVVPCDLPLLSPQAVVALTEARAQSVRAGRTEAIVATVDGVACYSLAIWPAAWASDVRRLIDGGVRQFRAALDVGPWSGVEVPADVVADSDTPQELRRLLGDP